MPVQQRSLTTFDTVALIVGIVVGSGIFKTPSLVAGAVGSGPLLVLAWVAGGLVTLIGMLCYAELTAAYPHAGGEYHFLRRSFGDFVSFLFAWSRITVIQTGSIALLGFLVGDYATQLLPLGAASATWYAVGSILLLTLANMLGFQPGMRVQRALMGATVLGLTIVTIAGFTISPSEVASAAAATSGGASFGSLGLAMIFVLLTYGGWSEAAYISAEVDESHRGMVRAFSIAVTVITTLYLVVNLSFLHGLGISGMAGSDAVAATVMERAFGPWGSRLISLIVVILAMSTMNGVIITGSRSAAAWGQDHTLVCWLGRWSDEGCTPRNALAAQGIAALLLVAIGTYARSGFVAMVDYTAPVFWFFLLLVGASLVVLRMREPGVERPFRVPGYPVTPIVFCFFCGYLLQSSLAYTGVGALWGVLVVVAGIPLYIIARVTGSSRA